MALIICKDCKKEISTDCKKCPHCGANKPISKGNVGCGVVGFLVILFLLAISSSDNKDAVQPSPPVPHIGSKYVLNDVATGCLEKEDLDKIISIVRSGDKEGAAKGLLRSMLGGRCAQMAKDSPVYITDVSVFSGMAKVRSQGEDREYWIPLGFIGQQLAE